MLVSLKWLGEICDLSGIDPPAVAAALTARGLTVDATLEGAAGVVLDVDVPANRPDCLGHLGLAREAAAAFGRSLLPRRRVSREDGEPLTSLLRLAVDDSDLCPRYTARAIRDVRVGPSPPWVRVRLEACGIRSINNVVDASNLVLLELGHPIHVFDLSRVGGGEIRVRRAAPGEKLTTLDGIERSLGPEMLVIADAGHPIALAGIIGGLESEIAPSTRDVLIEAAYFLPGSVRRTARRLGVSTDASQRFERGADPEGVVEAQETAVRLLLELAGGAPAAGMIDVRAEPSAARHLVLRPERVRRLLGFDPGRPAIRDALVALGLAPRDVEEGGLAVRPPSWRVDLDREEDLVEEVARQIGYDRIPAPPGAAAAPSRGADREAAEERCRTLLAHLGFHEAFNYSMNAADEDVPFVSGGSPPALAISNPIAETLTRLRRSLMPGLLRSADLNLRRGAADVRLFEIGHVFLPRDMAGFPDEPSRVAIAWVGARSPRHWSGPSESVDFPDAAGIVDAIIGALRPDLPSERAPAGLCGLHPGRSTAWTGEAGDAFAWCGEVHPDHARALGLPPRVFVAEVDLSHLVGPSEGRRRAVPLPRVPAVTRDLSLVLGTGTSWIRLLAELRKVGAPAPVRFEALDRYQGAPLAAGEVSVTVRVILQPLERTLTDVETEAYRKALVEAAESGLRARLRA
ncbi:MAG: phenylalanine--tRNA ligase subunit beta [Acidobacteriia bacterium]|nr:phenylalanine--tRNA ligase subunit beta [Terriglobia bacterium]